MAIDTRFLAKRKFIRILIALCFLGAGCSDMKPTRFVLKDPFESGIDFVNRIGENDSVNVVDYEYVYNGGGVGVGDFNKDGLPDVYLSGNMVLGKLFLNSGNLTFKDVTSQAGLNTQARWVTGVSVVDINSDGLDDLYLSVSGPPTYKKGNLLFVNHGIENGIPVFSEQAGKYNLKGNGNTTHTAFFDYDNDGDLDAYMLVHAPTMDNANRIHPKPTMVSSKANDRLYRNDTTGDSIVFTDVTIDAGIIDDGNGLGIAVHDLNGDGWEDIYVSNDYLPNDMMYLNNKDGTFTNVIASATQHQSYFAMGNDIADINNDGFSDIIVLDMLPPENYDRKMMLGGRNFDRMELESRGWYERQYIRNTLQLNNGITPQRQLSFSEIGQLSGIAETHWSWSPLLIDYDNDGFKDLSITNGYPKDITNRDFVEYKNEVNNFSSQAELSRKLKEKVDKLPPLKIKNYLFQNNKDLTFSDRSGEWGFNKPSFSNGSASADFDRDGDMDIIINNINDAAFLYENTLYKSRQDERSVHYLDIKLVGNQNNPSAIGAKVKIVTGGTYQYSQNHPYRGYQSSMETLVHFGIGPETIVDSIWITWPDENIQLLTNVVGDQILTVTYDAGKLPYKEEGQPVLSTLFTDATQELNLDFKHDEQLYIDFKNQPLLPHLYSQNGPGIAVGDVNGDGLEDFFIGGAFEQSGCLFIQKKGGGFEKKVLEETVEKFEEDLGVLLFDADLDNDLDLYVVSGGSEFEAGSAYYRHRLYINDGRGFFARAKNSIPDIRESGAAVNAADYDGDGDLDLFIGGRVQPNAFPSNPKSFILINETRRGDQPSFIDRTSTLAPELGRIGMVTSALWTDFNNDKKIDLIVAGEWMPIVFFQNKGDGRLEKLSFSDGDAINDLNGWWNCISGGDFDQDGDIDYIAGNFGMNSKFKPSLEKPVRMYAKDFDGAGIIDPIITYAENGNEFPIALREDLVRQMNGMRRRFTTHDAYARAKISDVLSDDEIKSSHQSKTTTFQSIYIENISDSINIKFKWSPLPMETQRAPVYGISINDFDGDQHLDLVLTGNFFGGDATFGRQDASIGNFLSGDGKGNFVIKKAGRTGIFVNGDAKGLATLVLNDTSRLLLVAQNNDRLRVFKSTIKSAKIFKPHPLDCSLIIERQNGSRSIHELYYGNSYLSQTTRAVLLPDDVKMVEVLNTRGENRTIKY